LTAANAARGPATESAAAGRPASRKGGKCDSIWQL
jgi:hypothetical protein